jgi:ribonuclease Z
MFSEIQKKGALTVAGKKISLFDVTWSNPGRKIVYSGDTAFSEAVAEAAKGADLLIHEGTFDASRKAEAQERKHSTVEDAARVAKQAGARKLVIIHISPRYSDDIKTLLEASAKIFKNTTIAEDGMKLQL